MKRVLGTILPVLLLSAWLSACLAVADPSRGTTTATINVQYAIGEAGLGKGKRLIPYTTITGVIEANNKSSTVALRVLTGQPERIGDIRRPTAIGAGSSGVFIIDSVTHGLYRFRWNKDTGGEGGDAKPELVRIRILTDMLEPGDLFVAPNGDIFICDLKGRRVVRYNSDGEQLMEFRDQENLNQPVSVTVDSRGLRIFVADGLYDRVIVFGPDGRALYGIGQRGDTTGSFRNIRSMVQGRHGLLYVVNGVKPLVHTFGLDGIYIGTFGQGVLTVPQGAAVDDEDRLYVADQLNHRLTIFQDGKMVELYGKHGDRPGEFNQPSRLSYYKGMLYVADTENGRVQIFKVVPDNLIDKSNTK